VLEFLVRIGAAFPDASDIRIYVTGSGSGPLAAPLGARFVQEVNAVTLAVGKLHPDVNAVVELGGQDAKIILFQEMAEGNRGTGENVSSHHVEADGDRESSAPPRAGQRQVITSMNDKCASGTGATIDKCMIKVGMSAVELSNLRFDPTRLHRVAAKCGVVWMPR
jgi:activator of 2-hydroxyglutaryl-CoA dehydratase